MGFSDIFHNDEVLQRNKMSIRIFNVFKKNTYFWAQIGVFLFKFVQKLVHVFGILLKRFS